ncbi:MAG: hypothetical protein P1U90_14375 [Akkermansiaceae bacterium]|nr:hypothetical protein [Akkermansiaceae bacterium]
MRRLVLVWFALLFPVMGEELEVRMYRVGEVELLKLHRLLVPGEEEEREDSQGAWLGKPIVEPGFESRFMKEGKGWVDCSKRIEEVLLVKRFNGKALIFPKKDVMVMKAGAWEHESFAEIVSQHRNRKIQILAEVYAVPEVKAGMRSIGFSKKPKDAELFGKISVTTLPGQLGKAKIKDGEMELEVQPFIDANRSILEARFTLSGELRGIKFRLEILPTGVFGMPWVHELGALDGKTTLLVVITPEFILEDGQREDAWILREKGGEFLRDKRLEQVEKWGEKKQAGEFRELLVMPNLIEWLNKGDEKGAGWDELLVYREKKAELAGVGLVYDVRSLFEQNGISFRDGDFIVFSKFQNRIYGKLAVKEHERFERVIKVRDEEFTPLIRIDFKQVDRDEKLLKKLGITVLPGQVGRISLGENLSGRVEAQLDHINDRIEVRLSLTDLEGDQERPAIDFNGTLEKGKASVINVDVRDTLRAWKVTADVLSADQVIRVYREELKR